MNWLKMSQREKDALVAERVMRYNLGVPPSPEMALPPGKSYPVTVPHYTTDHNAAVEVRAEIARRGLTSQFVWKLEDIAPSGEYNPYDYPSYFKWELINATPDQQCLAALRACGVEVE